MASMVAPMASITRVQPGWASCKSFHGDSKASATKAAAQCSTGGRVSTHCCSSFFGSGIHASSSSPIYNLNFSLAGRQAVQPPRRRKGQNLVVRGLFGLGVPELVVIAGVAALLFGPKKLPEIGRGLGKTVQSFQQAAKEFETAVKNPNAGGEVAETESAKPESAVAPPPPPPAVSTQSDQESS